MTKLSYFRALRSFKELEPDPNLQDLSTADLYRLLEVLDIMEGKKTAKISPKELKTLEYLMEAYQQWGWSSELVTKALAKKKLQKRNREIYNLDLRLLFREVLVWILWAACNLL